MNHHMTFQKKTFSFCFNRRNNKNTEILIVREFEEDSDNENGYEKSGRQTIGQNNIRVSNRESYLRKEKQKEKRTNIRLAKNRKYVAPSKN